MGTGQQPTWGWFRAPGSLGPVRPEMTRCIRNDFGRRRKFSKTERDKKKKRGILKFEFDWSTRNRLCCDWLIIISQRRQSTINIYRILLTCNFVRRITYQTILAKKARFARVHATPGWWLPYQASSIDLPHQSHTLDPALEASRDRRFAPIRLLVNDIV